MNNRTPTSFEIGTSISPLDGRNRHKLHKVSSAFSDIELTRLRLKVEAEYLIWLSEYGAVRKISATEKNALREIPEKFGTKEYDRVREIEKQTNHEAKAAEEFFKEKIRKTSVQDVAEMVHFGLTSDDINNLAYSLMIRQTLDKALMPEITTVAGSLKEIAGKTITTPMLSRTHGQPAAPTTVGKELAVFHSRLKDEIKVLRNLKLRGKLTGNTGNLNAHKFVFPQTDWLKFSRGFVSSLGLQADLATTQIEPYDHLIRLFQSLINVNNILNGLAVDLWIYISMKYFKLKLVKSEVGSTAMPHKINPIYFEGAEGGFGIANSLFEFYCRKLSYSRLQRDLSDSTVRRSFGIALAYSFLSYQSMNDGLARLDVDKAVISGDLDKHTEVLSEAIQNFLRHKNLINPYERTKEFFRGKNRSREEVDEFIKGLELNDDDKGKLLALQTNTYTGYADKITEYLIKGPGN